MAFQDPGAAVCTPADSRSRSRPEPDWSVRCPSGGEGASDDRPLELQRWEAWREDSEPAISCNWSGAARGRRPKIDIKPPVDDGTLMDSEGLTTSADHATLVWRRVFRSSRKRNRPRVSDLQRRWDGINRGSANRWPMDGSAVRS